MFDEGATKFEVAPLLLLSLKSGDLHENEQFTKDIRQPSRP